MNKYIFPGKNSWNELIKRPVFKREEISEIVQNIFDEVKKNGDQALFDFNKKFDSVDIENLSPSIDEVQNSENLISEDLKEAIQTAKENITKFHQSQKTEIQKIETIKGIICWRENRAIEKVGIYIPGGTAPLFSTVLMLAIPAQLAGCKEIILCTPPDRNGEINPAILYTAKLCGITKIFKTGGAQAVAAMTFGTESIPNVYKIFGPGNQFVVAAKELAQNYGVAIDMPAGPSEVLIIADKNAVQEFCAADLLSQAEHGSDSQVIFISTDAKILEETIEETQKQLENLPRNEFARLSLSNSHFILMKSLDEALEFSNLYAPEHLILAITDFEKYIPAIENAGSVFLGNYSCESAGDYASGTNHTLPTNGFAKNYSGVSLDSFVKKITFQNLSKEGIQNLGKTIEVMAEAEGLFAHKKCSFNQIKKLKLSTINITQFIRKNILELQPYISFRDVNEFNNPVLMDANESPFGEFNRYPDSTHKKIRTQISELKNISSEKIAVGNGSDELIDLIIKIFCEPKKDSIIIMNPSFAMYGFYASINENSVFKTSIRRKF